MSKPEVNKVDFESILLKIFNHFACFSYDKVKEQVVSIYILKSLLLENFILLSSFQINKKIMSILRSSLHFLGNMIKEFKMETYFHSNIVFFEFDMNFPS